MVKVLMFGWELPPFNSGGLGTACYGLTKSLAKKNIEITFVLPRKVPLHFNFLKLVFGDNDIFFSESRLYTAYSTKNKINFNLIPNKNDFKLHSLIDEVNHYAEIAERIVKTENFDIIHAHDWLTFKAAIVAKKISKKPLVVHIHATEFDRTGGNNCNQQVYEIEKQGMEKADLVITVSDFIRRKVIEKYFIDPKKVVTVHNGAEFESYELEKASEMSKRNKVVLFLGRLTIQKGPDYFIYAAKKIIEHMDNVIFLVVGSGDMENFLMEKTAELGISDKVFFTGFLRGNDLIKAFQMADVYVMPSVSEPFGLTPLESLHCKTPVIISKQSGVSEVLNHCLKVDFWNINEMANKIISVLNYPCLKEHLTENGLKEAKTITWDKSAEKCINIYNRFLNK